MQNNKFTKWLSVKELVDNRQGSFFVKERQVVWVNLGKNIGDEEDGKNEYFERPVLVLKVFNKNLFWGVAMSSKIKDDNKFYLKVVLNYKEHLNKNPEEVSIIISQMRIFDTKRVFDYIGYISKEDFKNTKSALRALL